MCKVVFPTEALSTSTSSRDRLACRLSRSVLQRLCVCRGLEGEEEVSIGLSNSVKSMLQLQLLRVQGAEVVAHHTPKATTHTCFGSVFSREGLAEVPSEAQS